MLTFKRIISFLLVCVLLVGMVPPVTVQASEAETVPASEEPTAVPEETTQPAGTEETTAPTQTEPVHETEPIPVTEEAPAPTEETVTEPSEETKAETEPSEDTTEPVGETEAATVPEEDGIPDETEGIEDTETEEILDGLIVSSSAANAGSNIVINGVDIGYGDGSYFTKNGQSCANSYWSNGRCHHNGVCTSTANSNCNCMRYWPTGNASTCQVDLLGSQCLSYARYCQWRAYGSFATGTSSTYSDLTGTISKANCTASTLKSKLLGCAPATHVRMPSPHSISILSTSDSGVTFTDCNANGYCRVRVVTWDWSTFASYVQGKGGITYSYARIGVGPGVECNCSEAHAGQYLCTTSSLNLTIRSGHGSSYSAVGKIPPRATVTVTKASGTGSSDWAHVEYNGVSGYATMEYLQKIEPLQIHCSISSVSLTLGAAESTSIHFWFTGQHPNGYTPRGYYTQSNGCIQASVNSPDSDGKYRVDITALKEGTDTIQLFARDAVTNEVITYVNIPVTVEAGTFSVSYNANGGSGAPSSQTKTHGQSLTLSGTIPTRFGYNFLGWATSSTATSASYQPGGAYTGNANLTLYAVWETAETAMTTSIYSDTATVRYANTGVYYRFIPSQSGHYRIDSTSDVDNKVYLYDASGNQLAYNDDGGNNRSFRLDYTFTKGTTYYIYVRYYNNSTTGSMNLTLRRGYTITYSAGGGSGVPAGQWKFHGTSLTLSSTEPVRSGFRFLGWATTSSATSAAYQPGGTYTGNANQTLYAVWSADTYTVTYNADGGSGAPASQTKIHGQNLTLSSTVPTRTGYRFLHWFDQDLSTYDPGDIYTANANLTLWAYWEADTCTVTYNANGGSGAPAAQAKTYGRDLTLSDMIPTKFGANFTGWSTVANELAPTAEYQPGDTYTDDADLTLYAIWSTPWAAGQTNVEIDRPGTGCYFKITTPMASTAQSIFPYTFYSTGSLDTRIYLYDADGTQLAADDDSGEGRNFLLNYNFSARQTYYIYVRLYSSSAVGSFTMETHSGYVLNYNAKGGYNAPTAEYHYFGEEAVISETVPFRPGYRFLGWDTSSNAANAVYQPGDTYTRNINLTLYAVWHANGYTVTYDANGGSGAPDAQTKVAGEELTLSEIVPTRSLHTFLGWATTADAEEPAYQPGDTFTENADTTLYAVWEHACIHGHDYTYTLTEAPAADTAGSIQGECSRCHFKRTIALPALDTADYSYRLTQAPTCTEVGTAVYTWKTSTYGEFAFEVSLDPTGHSYTDETDPDCDICGLQRFPDAEMVGIRANGTDVTGTTITHDLNQSSLQLSARALPENAVQSFTWSCSDASVAEVDETGLVTFTGAAGTVRITVTAADSGRKAASVTIQTVRASHNLLKDSEAEQDGDADIRLLGGSSVQLRVYDPDSGRALTARQITWSLDANYAASASVTAAGKLTTKKVLTKTRIEAVGALTEDPSITATYIVDLYPAVTQVILQQDSETVSGKTLLFNLLSDSEQTLTAQLYPQDVLCEEVRWTISDKKSDFASYVPEGNTLRIEAPTGKSGIVTIQAAAQDGSRKTASVKIKFGRYAQDITIESAPDRLASGESIQLNARVMGENLDKPGVVWSLKNAADKTFVTLSASGRLTAKKVYGPQEITIVAASKDGLVRDECTVTICPKAENQLVLVDENGDYVTKTTRLLDVPSEESIDLTAYIYDDEGLTRETVLWSVKPANLAELVQHRDGSATVTMLGAGTVTVTAESLSTGARATVTLKGVKKASWLEIVEKKSGSADSLAVASGKSIDLLAQTDLGTGKVTWSITEGAAYAALNSSGKLTAAKNLTRIRTVTVKAATIDGSGLATEARITLHPIAQGVQVCTCEADAPAFSIKTWSWFNLANTTYQWDLSSQGSILRLNADVYPLDAIQEKTWKSSAPKIADILRDSSGQPILDEEGNVQLKIYRTGTTTITVTADDGSRQKVSFKLKVVRQITELRLADQTVTAGKSLNLANLLQILPGDATTRNLTWEIVGLRGRLYASLSTRGVLKAAKVTSAQTVTVRVTANDGLASTTECTITILPAT